MTMALNMEMMQSGASASAVAALLDSRQFEPNGAAFRFLQTGDNAIIRDASTPANNFAGDANSKLTYSSPSTKYVRDNTGTYRSGTTLRCDHTSAGVPLGLLVEGARTNEIRNNSMQGAVAGSPGTLPTNHAIGNATGLTRTVATGTETGIEYIEYRFNGTTGDANGIQIDFEPTTQVVAATGQTWTGSAFMSLSAGSITNISTLSINLREGTAAGAFVANNIGTDFKASLTSTLQRFTHSPTLAGGGTTARVTHRINIGYSAGVAVDFTIRIGWPQLEQAAFASSPIRTTSAAVTRAADDIYLLTSALPSFSSGGYMVARFIPSQVVSAAHRALGLYQDGSNTTYVGGNTTGKRATNLIAGSGAPSMTPTGSLAAGTATTIAYSFAASNYKAASDGGTIQTSTTGATLPTYAGLAFGTDARSGSGTALFGWLQWAKAVPRTDLTNAQVVAESALT